MGLCWAGTLSSLRVLDVGASFMGDLVFSVFSPVLSHVSLESSLDKLKTGTD